MKLNRYIEHTLLSPDATSEDIQRLLEETVKYDFLGVCINPIFVKQAKDFLLNTNTKIITVVGFPLGANLPDIKEFETQRALEDGADEIDMVINLTAIKSKDYCTAENDIKQVKQMAFNKPVKVILETDFLTKDEIITACKICATAGANFVKTSTGFAKNGVGATVENVRLMSETAKTFGLEVKASGGISSREKTLEMINAGASRIGTSSGVKIVSDET